MFQYTAILAGIDRLYPTNEIHLLLGTKMADNSMAERYRYEIAGNWRFCRFSRAGSFESDVSSNDSWIILYQNENVIYDECFL